MTSPVLAPPPLNAERIQPLRSLGGGGQGFSEVLARSAPASPAQSLIGPGGPASEVLRGLEHGRQRLDQIIDQARSGRTFKPTELLALQAEVHRIGEEAALAHRLVEEGLGSLRRLWSMQL